MLYFDFLLFVSCFFMLFSYISFSLLIQLMEKQSDFDNLQYQHGFGNQFASQAKEGAIPKNQNSPVTLKYGLFAEQLSGTAFTMKRSENQRTWLYKARPSVIAGQLKPSKYPFKIIQSFMKDSEQIQINPNQLRLKQIPKVEGQEKVNFIQGLTSIAGAGDPTIKQGMTIYVYSANQSMGKTAFYNSDGDFLIVPFSGTLNITTLMGKLQVKPVEICVIPRGVKFTIDLPDGQGRGWVSQIYSNHLVLPQLGPIGSNGLAAPKDFQFPVAWCQDEKTQWNIWNKYIGKIFEGKSEYSPYDVAGWRGNYAPYKYDLMKFNTIGSISYDHPDPSIFTVLTCKSHIEGMACLDFAIFPPRWLVAQHTFKPPYYHRNCMSQFMGNICGEYDAKKSSDFGPGCSSYHCCMIPHGPDSQSYEKFVQGPGKQKAYKTPQNAMAFMFQSGFLLKTTKYALGGMLKVDEEYHNCWNKLKQLKFE